jgi:hypothetical protein
LRLLVHTNSRFLHLIKKKIGRGDREKEKGGSRNENERVRTSDIWVKSVNNFSLLQISALICLSKKKKEKRRSEKEKKKDCRSVREGCARMNYLPNVFLFLQKELSQKSQCINRTVAERSWKIC